MINVDSMLRNRETTAIKFPVCWCLAMLLKSLQNRFATDQLWQAWRSINTILACQMRCHDQFKLMTSQNNQWQILLQRALVSPACFKQGNVSGFNMSLIGKVAWISCAFTVLADVKVASLTIQINYVVLTCACNESVIRPNVMGIITKIIKMLLFNHCDQSVNLIRAVNWSGWLSWGDLRGQ